MATELLKTRMLLHIWTRHQLRPVHFLESMLTLAKTDLAWNINMIFNFKELFLTLFFMMFVFLGVVELVTSLIWVILVTVVVLIKGEAGFGLMNRFRR